MCDESYFEKNKYGTKFYYKNCTKPDQNIFHRTDGPAIETINGYKEWHINGKWHREDGPAIEWVNGTKSWYINGKQYSEEEYWRFIKLKVFI